MQNDCTIITNKNIYNNAQIVGNIMVKYGVVQSLIFKNQLCDRFVPPPWQSAWHFLLCSCRFDFNKIPNYVNFFAAFVCPYNIPWNLTLTPPLYNLYHSHHRILRCDGLIKNIAGLSFSRKNLFINVHFPVDLKKVIWYNIHTHPWKNT